MNIFAKNAVSVLRPYARSLTPIHLLFVKTARAIRPTVLSRFFMRRVDLRLLQVEIMGDALGVPADLVHHAIQINPLYQCS